MSGELYLIVCVLIVMSFLLLTAGGSGRTARPRTGEIDRIARHTAREIERTEQEYRRWIDQALRNDSGKR